MSIKGKKEGILRIIGSFLILLGLLFSILLNMFAINFFYLFYIIIVLPMFVKSVLLKLEEDIIVKHSKKFLVLITIYVFTLNLMILFNVHTRPVYHVNA